MRFNGNVERSTVPNVGQNKHSLFAQQKLRPTMTRGEDCLIAGVCSGIAERLEADAVVVRVTAVVLMMCTFGLVIIPYVALAVSLPSSCEGGKPLNVSPLDVCSDRYHRVVEARAARMESLRGYGVHADAGHMPPAPPSAVDAPRPAYSGPMSTTVVNASAKTRRRAPIVLALVALTTLLFIVAANYWVSRVPGVSLLGFWPALLIVAGTTLLVCFADKVPLALRLCGLVACIELCIALLPFTLGICPPRCLGRLSDLSALLWLSVAACFIIAFAFDRVDFLALGVGLVAVALTVSYLDIGVFDRLAMFSSYSRHNLTLSLFRG